MKVVAGMACLLVLAPVRAGAQQDPTARRWRDSLATITSLDSITALRTAMTIAARADRSDGMLALRRAYASLRLADIRGSVVGYEEAVGDFEEVSQQQPTAPAAWLGLGMAHLGYGRTADRLVVAVNDLLAKSPADRAADAFARGIEADTTSAVVSLLAEVALARRTTARSEATLGAMRRSVPLRHGTSVGALLARMRLERIAGELDSAVIAVELAASVSDDPLTLLELARTRLAAGRSDGVDPWYAALDRADGATLQEVRRDLVLLLPDTTLAAFDASPSAARAAFMRRYWNAQDPHGLPAHAERLREHYRRLQVARREYPLPEQRGDSSEFPDYTDARGMVLVWHGIPAQRAILSGIVGLPPSESWSYVREDGTALVFHFVADSAGAPFRRVESVLDILSRSNQARWFTGRFDASGRDTSSKPVNTYGAEWSALIAQQLLLSRWNVSDVYRRILNRGSDGAAESQAAERELGRASVAAPPTWSLAYELPLESRVSILAVGRDPQGSRIQIGFAVPGQLLRGTRTARGMAYVIRMRASIARVGGGVVQVVDTVRTFVARDGIAPGAHLLGRLPVVVPAGTFSVHVALENDGRGTITARDTVTVSGSGADELGVSDLSLGTRSIVLPWRTAQGDTAWINPLRAYRANEPILLHFEVSGLERGAPFRTRLRVVRKAGGGVLGLGGPAMLTLGFDHEHRGGVDEVQREIDLRRLRPGEYVLEVTVIAGDRQVTRREEFSIIR